MLKNKICFIGLTATGTVDWKPNPLERVYPLVGLQPSVFNSIIEKQFIKETDNYINSIINILILILSFYFTIKFSPFKGLVCSLLTIIIYSVIVFLLFWKGIWIDFFLPLIIVIFTFLGTSLFKFVGEIHRRKLLEKELDIARVIQKSFLPEEINEFKKIKIFHFMQPAKFVAGDLYDIIILDSDTIGIFIGDVSGKGVPAALIMAQTISLLRIFARNSKNPGEVLAQLNRELCGRLNGRFITAIYLVVDTTNNIILATTAGHPPFIFYNSSQQKITEIEPEGGPPLGVFDTVNYESSKIDASAGDKLVLYTDGVSEARNKNDIEYDIKGIKRAIELAPSDKPLLESIKKNVFEFTKGLPQHDDITLIVLEF